MNLPDWLDAEPGRLMRMAAHFKITPGAASSWRIKGVPVHRMADVEMFTGGAVTIREQVQHKAARQVSTSAA